MSWAVGDDHEHHRFRGYGVPAYCDAWAVGCRAEIDRGLGYLCDHVDYDADGDVEVGGCGMHYETGIDPPALFLCSEHTCADVDEASLPPEHPDWARHLLTDKSWQQWRDENPAQVAALAQEAPDER